jgi:hypothetical protein
MLRQRLLSFAVVLTALAVGVSAARAHEMKVPFAEVAQTANLIFVGTVESQAVRMGANGNMIFTDVTFADVEVVNATSRSKQKDASRVQLTFPGGTMDGITISPCTSLRVETGRRYVLFAFDDGIVYSSPLIGGAQGLFEVVRDSQTGEEFVLTAGQHAVLNVENLDLVSSDARVAAIDGGRIVAATADDSNKAGVEAPISADGVRATPMVRGKGGTDARPLTLRGFVDQIRTVSLKTKLTERTLRFGDSGELLKMVDGKVVRESLKQRSPHQLIADRTGVAAAPRIPRAGTASAASNSSAANVDDKTRGGFLGACGRQNLYIVMEQYPAGWSEWGVANDCMYTWNQSREVFHYVDDDGNYGVNDVNEFTGYPSNTDMVNIYGFAWGSALAVTNTRQVQNCGRIVEADLSLNPAATFSDDPIAAIGTSNVYLLRPTMMHELGHVWGEQDGELDETYDYDVATVMQAIYSSVPEEGRGVHATDARLIRETYDYQEVGADVGVESYYALNGLKNSTISGTTFNPGDAITLGGVTVENMSNFSIQNVNVRFYLSTDRVITTDDRQMGTNWYWEDFPGVSFSEADYPQTIPIDTPPGTYYVGAIVTINGFDGDSYGWNNGAFFADTVTVLRRFAPSVDRITAVDTSGRAFKMKLTGTELKAGMRVFIGADALEWTNTRFKRESLFVLKGGGALKRLFPVGVEVPIRLVNPDGGEATVTFVR